MSDVASVMAAFNHWYFNSEILFFSIVIKMKFTGFQISINPAFCSYCMEISPRIRAGTIETHHEIGNRTILILN